VNYELIVPDRIIIYILFQRTNCQYFPFRAMNFCTRGIFYKNFCHLDVKMRKSLIKQKYTSEIFSEYNDIKNWLPKECNKVLDVGCGIGGIDIFLFRHYNSDPDISFYLLDKTDIADNIYYGFRQSGAFYNSLEYAKLLLSSNGISEEKINLTYATSNYTINNDQIYDLILSLYSWGFHYPVSTYAEAVYSHLDKGGRVILDIRNNSNGIQDLHALFDQVVIISENKRSQRVIAMK
jgi:SAM-dependent methyltransferase